MFSQKEINAFSLQRAIGQIARQQFSGSLELEMLQEASEQAHRPLSPSAITLPWEVLSRISPQRSADWDAYERTTSRYYTRALDASTTGASVVGDDQLQIADVLRGRSVFSDLGATVITGARGNISMPESTGGADTHWLSDEYSPIAESRPDFAAVTATPRTIASLVRYSKLLETSAPQSAPFLEMHLARTLAQGIDAAIIAGSGAAGEPTGIINTAGVQTETLGGDPAAAIANALEACEATGARPSGFALDPALAKALRTTPVIAGSVPIMQAKRIDGLQALVSDAAPASTGIVGEIGDVVVVMFGSGLVLGVDPSSYFDRGLLQMRMLAHVDIIVRRPSSFVVIS